MAFSVRDWQKAALIRLITNAIAEDSAGGTSSAVTGSAAEDGILDTAWNDDWKVLLYDAHTKAVLSPLLTVAELRACGVTLHMALEAPRDSIPDVSASYFISAAPTSIRLLSDDICAGRYRDASIYVTPTLPRPLLESLAAATVAAGAVPRVTRLVDSYCSFVALQPRLLTSVGLFDSFAAFASPAADEAEVNAYCQSVTSSLVSICATVGITPVIVCSRGGPAEMVARQLEGALRDHLASPTAALFAANAAAPPATAPGHASGADGSIFDDEPGGGGGAAAEGDSGGGSGSASAALVRSLLHGRQPTSLGAGHGARPVLLLLDRTVDLATPLAHPSSYEALVDDCVGPIEGNRVTVPADTAAAGGGGGTGARGGGGGGGVALADLDEFVAAAAVGAAAASAAGGGAGGGTAWLTEWVSGGGKSGAAASGAAPATAGRVVTLDPDGDPFWARHCRAQFPDAIEVHGRELAGVVAREAEIRRIAGASGATDAAAAAAAAGGGLDGVDDAGGGGGGLSSAIEGLPALLRRKRCLETHTHLLHAVMARVAARTLPHFYEAEAPLLQQAYGSGGSGGADRAAVLALVRDGGRGSHADRLRLAAVHLLSVAPQTLAVAAGGAAPSASALLADEAELLLAALAGAATAGPASGYAAAAAAVLHYVRSLRTTPGSLLTAAAPHLVAVSSSAAGGGVGSGGVGSGGLFSSFLTKAAAQVVSRLGGQADARQLPVTAIAAAVCDAKPAAAAPFPVDQYLVCDPRAAPPRGPPGAQLQDRTFGSYVAAVNAAYAGGGGLAAAGGASPAAFRNAFVFMVGGGCYSEAADLQAWASAAGSSASSSFAAARTVVYGGTEMVAAASFLSQLRLLGKGFAGAAGGLSTAGSATAQAGAAASAR